MKSPYSYARFLALLLITLTPSGGFADDTDLFVKNNGDQANILILVDTSGELAEDPKVYDPANSDAPPMTQQAALKQVLSDVIMTASSNLNIGVMHFDDKNYNLGRISHPIKNLNNPGKTSPNLVRDDLITLVNSLSFTGASPFTRSLYDAAKYFNGDYASKHTILKTVSPATTAAAGTYLCDATNIANGVCRAIAGDGRYKNPLDNGCTNNYIIVISRSAAKYTPPSPAFPYDINARDDIAKYIGLAPTASCPYSFSAGTTANRYEDCGPDLAAYLRNSGKEIQTNTVSFMLSGAAGATNFNQAVAASGGGTHYIANDLSSLKNALNTLIGQIKTGHLTQQSYAAPATLLTQAQSIEHSNHTYIPFLEASNNFTWRGNIKNFSLSEGILKDKNNDPVYNQTLVGGKATYTLNEAAVDYWEQNTHDGTFVNKGGAESHISAANRIVYWDNTNSSMIVLSDNTDFRNYLTTSGLATKLTTMGIDSAGATRWINGYAYKKALGAVPAHVSTTVERHVIGDILHSKPVTVTFNGASYLFVGTNQGFLHMFRINEPGGGEEVFSFIPRNKLKELDKLIKNDVAWQHSYGFDGNITVVQNATKDKLYVYFGMRRGGQTYYALEINTSNVPKLLWQVSSGDSGFTQMGQTWAKPIPTHINNEPVLIFGGGYDVNMDSSYTGATGSGAANKGSAVYIVNALTGNHRWSTEADSPANPNWLLSFKSKMKYSFANDIAVLDLNADGNVDQFYGLDVAGQLWRFDVDGWSITTGIAADLKPPSTPIKFYTTPDVSIISNGAKRELAVSMGSGWRENPFDWRITDYLFSLRQPLSSQTEYSTTPILFANLADAPAVGDPAYDAELVTVAGDQQGWKYALPASLEKTFSDTITLDNKILFTTVVPVLADGIACTPGELATFKVYAMSVLNSAPFSDLDDSGDTGDNGCDGERCTLINMAVAPTPYFNDNKLTALITPGDPISIFDISAVITYWNDEVPGD